MTRKNNIFVSAATYVRAFSLDVHLLEIKLTSHLHLMPRLRIDGATSQKPPMCLNGLLRHMNNITFPLL
jgi:hypothetical protein